MSIQNTKNGRDNLTLALGDTVTVEQTPGTVVMDAIPTFFRVGFLRQPSLAVISEPATSNFFPVLVTH